VARTKTAFCIAGCLLLACSAASTAPLPTRDQNPLLAGFGLPSPMPSRVEGWQWSADFNWGNSAIIQDAPGEQLIVDAETREVRVSLNGKVADRWLVAASVPWRSTSAGSLDHFIDSWHDFFNLPTGNRTQLSTDALRVSYRDGNGRRFDRRTSMSGIGDIDIAAGLQVIATPQSSLAAWLDAKLPTGSSSDLDGSGATDVSIVVAGEHRFAGRWSVFGQAGATYLGEGDMLPDIQRQWVGSASAGVTARFWRSLDLTLQFDGHTAAFDSRLDYLGEAVILNLGGAWHFDNGLELSLGLSEDVMAEASPDVVFIVGVRRGLAP
jgi:hypothetical protein